MLRSTFYLSCVEYSLQRLLRIILLSAFLIIAISSKAQNITVTATATQSCADNGSLSFSISGGTNPYTVTVSGTDNYTWTSGSTNLTSFNLNNLKDGGYYISVKDANGAWGDGGARVEPMFTVSSSFTPEVCSFDGSATVTPSGGTAPYTYLWSNGSTSQTATNLSAYEDLKVEVTDANGCKSHPDSLWIPANPTIQLTTSFTEQSCNNPGTGTVNASGGAAPYSYYWHTTPIQTTKTATLFSGSHKVTVTDANGCTASSWVYVSKNSNGLSLSISYTEENCSLSDGTASVISSNGTAPFTYLWSNGQTTSTATGLSRGWYNVVVEDANSCQSSISTFLERTTPFSISFNTTSASCNEANGAASVSVSGGIAPYTYTWSNSASSSAISNLTSGGYAVTITDASGCSAQKSIYVPSNCNPYAYITGRVFHDANGNCVQDPNEYGIPGVKLQISNGWVIQTNRDGYYFLNIVPGTYTIEQIVPDYWNQICPSAPASISVNASAAGLTYSNNDFANQIKTLATDVSVDVFCGRPRPGFVRYNTLVYTNRGTVPASGKVEYTFSGPWSFNTASPMPDAFNTSKAEWNFTNLQPGESRYISIGMEVGINVSLGLTVAGHAIITPLTSDVEPSDNEYDCAATIVNSYDPNDITVSPKGEEEEGYISEQDTLLSYTIRFQNTGTDTAYVVRVTDTIDVNLKDYTIDHVLASHNHTMTIKDNILEFLFNDINLADSCINEEKSHGFIRYKIKRNKSMLPGAKVYNKADIFFDYNIPVETNTVQSTIKMNTDMDNRRSQDIITASPVPCSDKLTINFPSDENTVVTVRLYTVTGQEISILENYCINSGNQKLEFDLSGLNLLNGLYTLELFMKDRIYNKKIIIIK